MQTKNECIRCGAELEDGEECRKDGQSFCECCYDDMFVPWPGNFSNKEEK